MKNFLIIVFLGPFGVHKFLAGNKKMGFIYLFTFGIFGFGWIIDVIIALIKIKSGHTNDFTQPNPQDSTLSAYLPSASIKPNQLSYTADLTVKEDTLSDIPIKMRSENKSIIFPDWYISVSFGKSTSANYLKAVTLAKAAPQYHEQYDSNQILHQAIYSSSPKEYLAFITLYELVKDWKSSFVAINGQIIDRKIIGNLNYCYGDRCRSGNKTFCYGASYMTENPFGCHRLQISAANSPWWSFYTKVKGKWVLDKASMKEKIDSYASMYSLCPVFDYEHILLELNKLPDSLTDRQLEKLQRNNFGLKM